MDPSAATILIIDASAERRGLLGHLLAEQGSRLLTAASAEQALAILLPTADEDPPPSPLHLILLDLTLAGALVDGIALSRRLQSHPDTAAVPVIMLGPRADNQDASLQEAFALGALDYLATPIRRLELALRVAAALRQKEEWARGQRLTAELAEAQALLRHTTLTDGLTGLANRRCFDEFLDKEWRRCRREQQPITLCLAGLDFFRAFNNGHGHDQGDECLQKVAAILAACVKRPGDLVARYSGTVFAIILSETPDPGGWAVASRIMQDLAARPISHGRSPISDRVTLSIGVALLTPRATTPVHDLLVQADQALYDARNRGGNQISPPFPKNPGPR